MKTLGVLLAAGASRRFGAEDKLLAAYKGQPLVESAAQTLLAAGCDAVIAVTSSPEVAAILPQGMMIQPVGPDQAMSQSFETALAFAEREGFEQLLVLLGDMPGITTATVQNLKRLGGQNRACCYQGARMPPALLRCSDLRAVLQPCSDQGARQLIATIPPSCLLELSAVEAHDIDHKKDLEGL